MEPGMASPANGNQRAILMQAGPAVVDADAGVTPADLATPAVARQNPFPAAGEEAAGAPVRLVAGAAAARREREIAAAGAEQRALARNSQNELYNRITYDNARYRRLL
jgi:hypothetical protein